MRDGTEPYSEFFARVIEWISDMSEAATSLQANLDLFTAVPLKVQIRRLESPGFVKMGLPNSLITKEIQALAHHNTVLSQLLELLPRHEFERLANAHDGKRRSNALSRWSQFVALAVGHLGGRASLRDIESTFQSETHHRYHLGCQPVSKSALGRANETLRYELFEALFHRLYQRCTRHTPRHGFRFKHKLFSLDASLIDVSMKVFPWANYNRMKAAFKLHVGLDHEGLIPGFAAITLGKRGRRDVCHEHRENLHLWSCVEDGGMASRSLPAGVGFKPSSVAAFKRRGGERLGKRRSRERQVSTKKMSANEPLMTHRESLKKLSKLRKIPLLRISLKETCLLFRRQSV